MKEEKYNPGPWEYFTDGFYGCIRSADKAIIAGGEPCEGYLWDDANTRLMIAAPDLLEALKDLCECIDPETGDISKIEWERACRAIEKAERK